MAKYNEYILTIRKKSIFLDFKKERYLKYEIQNYKGTFRAIEEEKADNEPIVSGICE